MSRFFELFLSAVVITFLGFHTYKTFHSKAYEDKNYGFTVYNTRGWKVLESQENVYLSFGTYKDGMVLSYVGIEPLLKNINYDKDANSLKGMCDDLVSNSNATLIDFKTVRVGGLSGYSCEYEVYGVNLKQNLYASSIVLLGKPTSDYDFMISTSFPRNNQIEQRKVEGLVDSFLVN